MKRFLLFLLALSLSAAVQAKDVELKSPDGKVVVMVNTDYHVSYSVKREGVRLLAPSQISMTLLDGTLLGGGDFFRVSRRTVNQTVSSPNFKRASVKDHFNEVTLSASDYDIIFRAYDDGVAYRFVTRDKSSEIAIASEQAEFAFPADWKAYVPYVARDSSS